MLHYIIELAVWLLGSYFAGACIGCILRKLFSTEGTSAALPAAVMAAPVVAAPVIAAPVVAAPVMVPPRVVAPVTPPRPALAPVAAVADVPRTPRMERPRGIALARNGKPDDLVRISGVGPKNEKILHSLGYFHFDQIAAWTPENVAWVDDHLKFNGRIGREEWINQARLLAEGNDAEFTRLYGTGGEGSKDTGLRTVRGPREQGAEQNPVAALMSDVDKRAAAKLADDKDAAAGKMNRPKGIAAARGGKADDLQRISGVGPKNESVLHSLGFYHFDQIAAWTSTEVNWVDDHLRFGGRIKREEWIRQARLLAEGKEAEFTKLYGTGGLKNRKGETLSGSRTKKT
jgi:predicted flap endonuclease-1-like 5' DNA nuclease